MPATTVRHAVSRSAHRYSETPGTDSSRRTTDGQPGQAMSRRNRLSLVADRRRPVRFASSRRGSASIDPAAADDALTARAAALGYKVGDQTASERIRRAHARPDRWGAAQAAGSW